MASPRNVAAELGGGKGAGGPVINTVRSTFGAKLLAIVATAALAFVVITVVSSWQAARVHEQLAVIEQRYLPRLALGHGLATRFEHIRRSFEDVVAARDLEALQAMRELKDDFLAELASANANAALDTTLSAELRTAFEVYFAAARDVSRRRIAGESDERLADAVAALQAGQLHATDLLRRATALDERELAAAFRSARTAQQTASDIRLIVSVTCLLLVLVLSLWVGRGVLRSLGHVTAGFQRFGSGDFGQPIRVIGKDEIAQMAERANLMAHRLQELGRERARADWIKTGHVGLLDELRGDLTPAEVCTRAVAFLARYLDAPAGAFYALADVDVLRLLGHYASSELNPAGEARPRFRIGEGLVGQAALNQDITVVTDLPAGHLRLRSGLGESAPGAVALVPLAHAGKVLGVIELALLRPWSPANAELLGSVRETLAIALEVAHTRAALRDALAETQRQAQRLATQEEELRATNEELGAQQQELRRANEELRNQAHELEARQLELEQTNLELGRAHERLEHKAAELSTVSAYKSQFLANMSHELRTPLNSMLLLSDLLSSNEAGNLSDKQVEFCRTIHGAGRDLLALINQVLDLAKIESGKQEVRLEAVSVQQLASHAERIFAPLAREKGLDFEVEIGDGVPEEIWTDRQRIDQILNNLIGNAIKFTERGKVGLRIAGAGPGARIERSDLRADRALCVTVADTGIGIAAEHLDKVFAPFEQVEGRSNRRYGGTGLGLTIARDLAALLGGELQLRSEPGVGSTFTLYLPLQRPAAAGDGRAQALSSVSGAHAHAHAPRSNGHDADRPDILLVEDDPVFARSVSEIVREQGLQCVVASDGQSALQVARERRPRGIILDIKLPDLDGFTVIERLRADAATAAIPVHFVSALEAAERGMALGAVGYLTKPATHRDLTRVVESLVPRRAGTCRVLVVEDDASVAESLVERLRGEDIEIHREGSAAAALRALHDQRFHCMILDLALPDMDGLEFLEALRLQNADAPPVVVYTGRPLSKAEAQRLEAYTEAIVLKEGTGADRLLDEVRLFARRLREGLPTSRKPAPRLPPVQVRLKDRKLLLADDDMRTVYALSALLRAKGAEVLVADTGVTALSLLAEHPEVDAVLMDIMMPEMDGYEAIRRIREQARFAALPIVALTAKAMKGDRSKCLEAGASDYLSKPIDPDALLEILHGRLSERGVHGA